MAAGYVDNELSHLRHAFIGLHVAGGLVLLPILILTLLLSRRIQNPQPVLINFLWTWVLNSIGYLLLILSGRIDDPPRGLCFVQSVIIHGSVPMCAMATFMLVLELWWMVGDPQHATSAVANSCRTVLFLAAPYIAFAVYAVATSILQMRKAIASAMSARNGLYCTIKYGKLRSVGTPTFAVIMLVLMVGFEIAIGVRYYRLRRQIINGFPLAVSSHSKKNTIIRIALFNIYLLITMGASVGFLRPGARSWPYVVQAALPVVIFLLFSTQRSVLHTWMFWRKEKSPESSSNETLGARDLDMNMSDRNGIT